MHKNSRPSFTDFMEVSMIFVFTILLYAGFGAWALMLAIGNAYHLGLIDFTLGFWQTLSISYWLGAFFALYSGRTKKD